MRRSFYALAAAAALATAACAQVAADPKPAESWLGINLNGPADWNAEQPFVDVFRLSREWISQREGQGWGQGPKLDLDEHGWIRRLEPGCFAETPMMTGLKDPHRPAGEYVCLYAGKGTVEFWNVKRTVKSEPGRIVVEPGGDTMWLRIRATDPADPVRDIRVLMPGFEEGDLYRREPFRPGLLKQWASFNTYRFMDWMETNGSPQKTWADRPKPDDATWTRRGIPLEVMIDICNRAKVNPWFCLPHQADDDYVKQFAQQVKDKLDPALKVHIEYSNEVWNSMFAQNRYAQDKGKELGLGPKERPWEGAGMYYARRSLEIFGICEKVFGGRDRLVRVLAWQAASPWWVENIILPTENAGKNADALAIAPYITFLPRPGGDPSSDTVGGWTVEQILDYTEQKALPECLGWMKQQKALADRYGLKLVCYEAGQHLVGVGGGENNQALTDKFTAANRHPRMGAIYTKYLDGWRAAGGDLMCMFASVGGWSKWGSWGLAEWIDETEADQPKLGAVMAWNRANGRPAK
ncbi:MAG: hypothetical protein HZB16_17215 [Armatimonadetes bacterium]|nr:hypothetical protein [Armatimonadota bacterium]